MNNEEKILEMLSAMQADMKGMHERIDKLTEGQGELRKDLDELRKGQDELRKGQDELREDLEEVRTSVNALVDWSEKVSSIEQLRIPKIG